MSVISERQMEIIEATGVILMEQGVAGLTTKNLAERMNFSESALYRHFKNKNEILVGHIRYLFSNVKERLSQIPVDDITAQESIERFMESQFRFLNANRHFVVAMLSEGLLDSDSPVKAACLEIFAYVRGFFGGVLTKAISRGELSSLLSEEDIFYCVMGSFRVTMLRWKLNNYSFDLETEGNRFMKGVIQVALHNK